MEKYETLGVVGEGSYGLVLKCRHRESGQTVAIKRFLETEDDAAVRKMALREIRMLKKLRHENLVSMLEVFRRKRRFYLVFEFMDHTLLEELEEHAAGGLGEATVRRHAFQIARGLDFCHANNIVHRDVKPENVLVSRLGVVKLCDFGFARVLASPGETYTDYVATRWYRAPELLVGDTHYGREVDVWAVGCLMAEMMTANPLFAGDSDIDQLFLITKALGKLSARHQQLVARNPMFKGMRVSSAACGSQHASLYELFPSWPRLTLDFTAACLRLDPGQRPATAELLQHLYFTTDNFPAAFLPELRARLHQECQANPLLSRRFSNAANSARGREMAQLQQLQDYEERVTNSTAVNMNNTGAARVGSGPRWKVQLMGTDLPENNRRGDFLKAAPNRRPANKEQEWMDSGAVIAPSQGVKLSPTRVPSRLQAGPLFARTQPLQLGEPPVGDVPHGLLSPVAPHQQEGAGGHGGGGQQGGHLYVLHPAINNLSFSTGHTTSTTTTRLAEPLKRSPLGVRLKERGNAAPPLAAPAPGPRSHARRLVERGLGLGDGRIESVDKHCESPPPLGPPMGPPLAWAAGRKLAPMRHRGSLLPGAGLEDFSLPNVPGATGSPSKGMKKKERLTSNLSNMDTTSFPSPDKSTGKRNTSALDGAKDHR